VIKEKPILEYEEAPSGYIFLNNFKEPLMKFSEGYGFLGVLAMDGKEDKVQCHLCGEWFEGLGNHIHKEHNMKALAYKEIVGLSKNTALIGEKLRAKLIAHNLGKRIENLRIHKRHSEESKRKIAETLSKNVFEKQNITNTCPAQILERLKNKAEQLGRTPTTYEITFYPVLLKIYGSMKEACRLAGLTYTDNKEGHPTKYTKEYCVKVIRDFYLKNKRLPANGDWGKNFSRNFRKYLMQYYDDKEIFREAIKGENLQNLNIRLKWDKETLIDFLKNFEKINNRKPSYSDSKRGFIPSTGVYAYHFGNLKNALQIAFN